MPRTNRWNFAIAVQRRRGPIRIWRDGKIVPATGATVGQYFYDGDGKRVKKIVPATGEVTVFVYDAAGKLIAEYSPEIAAVEDARVAYLTNDHLGSPRINTDRDGNVTSRHDYHPFGEEISTSARASHPEYSADSVRKQFIGYERDNETSLDFAQARYYGNSLGRFTSADPLAASALPADPQTFNRYAYVRNSPTVMIDPTGMMGDYYTRDLNYIGSDGKDDGKYYYAEIDYLETRAEGPDIIHVINTKEFTIPSAENQAIRALATGVSNGVDDATTGMARGAGNFGIGTFNSLTNPLGVAGAAAGAPNPFAIQPFTFDNPRQASYGSATEIGLAGGTLFAGGVFGGASSLSVVPEASAVAPAVHGNSLASLRSTWGYKLFQNDGVFLKNGITSQRVAEARYTKAFMEDKFMVKELFPNRRAARTWEFGRNTVSPGPLNIRR